VALVARSPAVTHVYETQIKINIAVLFVLFVIVLCYDWVLTHIVSAITLLSQRKLMLSLVCCMCAVY